MKQRVWVIVGATSLIAKQFAHLVAEQGMALHLIARDKKQLNLIANDIQIRHKAHCTYAVLDVAGEAIDYQSLFPTPGIEYDLLLAVSDFTDNTNLVPESIDTLIKTNVLAVAQMINTYLNLAQTEHNLVYLSSVAACRGRAKNSLYGGTKALIETYIQGLQQNALATQHLLIARLGFIDTKQTYGLPGVFYAAPPKECAKACWKALKTGKRLIYYPFFWRLIMTIIRCLPHPIYKKIADK